MPSTTIVVFCLDTIMLTMTPSPDVEVHRGHKATGHLVRERTWTQGYHAHERT